MPSARAVTCAGSSSWFPDPRAARGGARTATLWPVNPLAGVLSEAWAMYRAHARHLLTIAFVIYIVAAAIEAVFGLLGGLGVFLAAIVGIVAAFLLQAALVKAVEDVRDGRVDLSLSETVQAARPAVGKVA